MATKRSRPGKLVVGVGNRGEGRKIDTWKFYAEDVVAKRGEPLAFDVFMNQNLDFTVTTAGIPSERFEPMTGKILAELHAKAQEIARDEFDIKNTLKWSDWLEVRICRHRGKYDFETGARANNGAKAHVEYTVIPRADAKDGRAFTVNGNNVLVPFPKDVGLVEDQPGDGGFRPNRKIEGERAATLQAIIDDPNASYAAKLDAKMSMSDRRDADTQFVYLPDTPENRAGLDAIIQAIEGINQRLLDFLAPDNIQDTLARALVNSSRLLAGPSEAPRASSPRPGRSP